MVAKFSDFSVDSIVNLVGLFNATAKSFEQEAQRITRQIQPGSSRTGNKRANGR